MKSIDVIIKEMFGISEDAIDLTPMDKGECKKVAIEYAKQFKQSNVCNDLCHSLPTTPFEGATCRKYGKLK